jgi:Tfp pilus assembly protein PilF
LWLEAYERYSTNQRIRLNLGSEFLISGKLSEAKRLFEDVIAVSPEHYFAYSKLALVYREKSFEGHSLEKADQLYRISLRLNPNDIVTIYNYGTLMIEAGLLDRAEGLFRSALVLNPRFGYAVYQLGLVALERGRKEEGVALLRQAVALDPRIPGIQNKLKQIE